MDVRESLLKAAIAVYADAGVRGATTRRIAQQAGVNEVTLFRHFKTKDELLDAALAHFARNVTTLDLPVEPVDPHAELIAWCKTHHRELYKIRALIRRSMGEYEQHPGHCQHGMQASVRIAAELSRYLQRLKARHLAAPDFDERVATNMLMGAIFADAMGRDTMPERYPYSMRDAIDQYVTLLLRAIGAAEPTPAPVTTSTRKGR